MTPNAVAANTTSTTRRRSLFLNRVVEQSLRSVRLHVALSFIGVGRWHTPPLLFMWQDDMIGVVHFVAACLERILQTSDQP